MDGNIKMSISEMHKAVFLLASGLICSYLTVWLILKTPIIFLFKDKPGIRKVHQRVIPRIGGLAILSGFLIISNLYPILFPSLPQLPIQLKSALNFSALAILLVGLADDMIIFHIHNKAKFFLEVLIATEIVFLNDIQLYEIDFLDWNFQLSWMGIPLSIIWIVGVTNAVNIIDGVDGLAGSIMLVVFITLGIITAFTGNMSIFFLSVIFCGLIIGFLIHNISPARVFLGDTGSLFLGMITGILSLYLITKGDGKYPHIVAPLLVGLPILDISAAMGRRFIKRIISGTVWYRAFAAMSVADNEHMHHRLVYRGLTHTETVFVLMFFHSVICMGAIMATYTGKFMTIFILSYIATLVVWFLYKLNFFDRITYLIRSRQSKVIAKRQTVNVINADDVLSYSLVICQQNAFQFNFGLFDVNEINDCGAVIIVQKPDEEIEVAITMASQIYAYKSCPVIVITHDTVLPEKLQEVETLQGAFLIVKKPVYIPVLLRELLRLIRQSRKWGVEKINTDTRQFFRQALLNEEV